MSQNIGLEIVHEWIAESMGSLGPNDHRYVTQTDSDALARKINNRMKTAGLEAFAQLFERLAAKNKIEGDEILHRGATQSAFYVRRFMKELEDGVQHETTGHLTNGA